MKKAPSYKAQNSNTRKDTKINSLSFCIHEFCNLFVGHEKSVSNESSLDSGNMLYLRLGDFYEMFAKNAEQSPKKCGFERTFELSD